jgi:hypothetical protein
MPVRKTILLCNQPENGFPTIIDDNVKNVWDHYTKEYPELDACWYLSKNKCFAELLQKGETYRIFFDYDVYAENDTVPWTEHEVYALREVIHRRFPEVEKTEEIYCAMKASRLDRGKIKHSARFFIGKIVCPYDCMGDLLKERGFTKEEGWDLGIYGNRRRLLNCVHQYKPRDTSKTVLKPLPNNPADRSLYPANILMTAQFLYGNETVLMPTKIKEKKVEPAPHVMDKPKIDTSRLQKYLECIHPDVEYTDWFKVLCAAFHTAGDDACEVVRQWSAKGTKYDGDRAFYRKWDTLNANHENKAGDGTLRALAKQGNPERYKELFENYTFVELEDDDENVDLYECRDYDALKRSFEKRVFKIANPCMFYVQKSDDTFDIKSLKGLQDSYMNIRYHHTDEKGKTTEKSFIGKWITDPKMRQYEMEKFDPTRTVGRHVYNTFAGFAGEKAKRVDGDLTLILNHFDVLFGKENSGYVLKWFANILQNPTRKSNVALMLHSEKEGTGKTMLVSWFAEKILGREYYRKTADPKEDLFGRFANTIPNRLLVLIEEASGHDIRGKMDKLKDLVTDKICRLEIKGIAKMEDVPNYANFIFTTNNTNPIQISNTDRRFCTFHCDHNRAQDTTYFDPLGKAMEDDAVAGAFYQKLMAMDLTGFNFQAERPKTDYYQDLQQANLPSWAMFLSRLCNTQGVTKYMGMELYNSYRVFCDQISATPTTPKSLMMKIKKYVSEATSMVSYDEAYPIKKTNGKKGVYYEFDFEKLKDQMRKNNEFDTDI